MSIYVDFKVEVWERVHISKIYETQILKDLEEGVIQNSSDILDVYGDLDVEYLSETNEQISLAENEGQETICVFKSNGEQIFSNETLERYKPKSKVFALISHEETEEDIMSLNDQEYLKLAKEIGLVYNSIEFAQEFNLGSFSTETHQLRILEI